MSVLGSSAVATFVASADPERSREFYEDKLGLTFVSDDEYALVFDANGTTLRIQKAGEFTPQQFTVLGWHVADIDAAMAELRSRGVEFEQYPWMPPESGGVMEFPGGAKVAWFKDPDGNVLSLDQY
jgi:catechol 2,3-dioxygenase-like lactoylglutathione lyase family enzyme